MTAASPPAVSHAPGPNAWLRELTRLNKPAAWRWGPSLRAALGMAVPLGVGLATQQLALGLLVALGYLMQMNGERDGPYEDLFRRLLITAPLGAAGALLGYASGLPWGWIVLLMMGVSFLASVASSYSAALSIGTMQALVLGTVALGNPALHGSALHMFLMLLVGTALYALLLGVEALLQRSRPRREMLAALLLSLSRLAEGQVSGAAVETQRRQVTTQLAAVYALMLQTRSQAQGRSSQADRRAAVLRRADGLFAAILACSDSALLSAAARDLNQMAEAVKHAQRLPVPVFDTQAPLLSRAVAALGVALWGPMAMTAPVAVGPVRTDAPGSQAAAMHSQARLRVWLDRLVPGRDVLLSALALALCVGIAYALRWLDDRSHWYWLPMTVFLVMKPDLGSIFGRTVLRCLGTAGGVLIGAAILAWLPPGPLFIGIMALIALLMPQARQISYAVMTLTMTPLVLVLIDLVSPETKGIDYALLRLVDTLGGGAVVLIFGYLIWPKSHHRQLAGAFQQARQSMADYLLSTLRATDRLGQEGADAAALGTCRRTVYGQLANMRAILQKTLADPPPSGREAAAWFPIVTSAERVCDAITAYSMAATTARTASQTAELERLAACLAGGATDCDGDAHGSQSLPAGDPAASRLVAHIREEVGSIQSYVGGGA
ncbi:FUSC family protein [Corticimicrobacter populi]|nr:FUSC family protein [Corticimicrobacter populi]